MAEHPPGLRPRPRAVRAGALLAALALAAVFAWLGTWQLERRVWKMDLIARVERRLATAPVAAPGPAGWLRISRASDEYRRVRVTGRFLPARDTLVAASTVLGPGYWLLTPLRDVRGFTVLINRGFVPSSRPAVATPSGTVSIDGLLRITEPDGDLLRSNDPRGDRWYSRDVRAIATARTLDFVAPFFIDAAAIPGTAAYPRGGLTVIAFPDNHLVYALTWYALAAMAFGIVFVGLRAEVRRPSNTGPQPDRTSRA